MDAQASDHFDRADADECQGDEEKAVFGRSVSQHVGAHRVHEGDAEGLDAERAAPFLARRGLVDGAFVQPARWPRRPGAPSSPGR